MLLLMTLLRSRSTYIPSSQPVPGIGLNAFNRFLQEPRASFIFRWRWPGLITTAYIREQSAGAHRLNSILKQQHRNKRIRSVHGESTLMMFTSNMR